jgi:hypothetical protein
MFFMGERNIVQFVKHVIYCAECNIYVIICNCACYNYCIMFCLIVYVCECKVRWESKGIFLPRWQFFLRRTLLIPKEKKNFLECYVSLCVRLKEMKSAVKERGS